MRELFADLLVVVGDITVEVRRKQIRSFRIAVYPPEGRVRMSVPLLASDGQIRRALLDRHDWILARQADCRARQKTPEPDLVQGGVVLFLGRELELLVQESASNSACSVCLSQGEDRLVLTCPAATPLQRRRAVLDQWYKDQLAAMVPPLLAKWEAVMGVHATSWLIRSMKSRWGSCNITSHRITLGLELARKSPSCIEYVVVHELCHLLEAGHGQGFKDLMARYLPDWRQRRRELEGRA